MLKRIEGERARYILASGVEVEIPDGDPVPEGARKKDEE